VIVLETGVVACVVTLTWTWGVPSASVINNFKLLINYINIIPIIPHDLNHHIHDLLFLSNLNYQYKGCNNYDITDLFIIERDVGDCI
jgi:hypothetical protein